MSTVYQESYLAWGLFISYNMCQQSTKNLTLLGGFLFPTICVNSPTKNLTLLGGFLFPTICINSLPRILPCLGAFYFLQYVSTVYQESYLAWRLFISYNMCLQSTKNLTLLGGFLFPTICVNSLPRILPCLEAFYFLQYVSTVYQESYLVYQESYLAWRLFISYNMCQQSTKNLTLLGGFLFPTICVNSLPRILPCLEAFYFLQYVSTVYQESYLAWRLFISYNMCQQSTKNLTLLGGFLFPTICVNSLPRILPCLEAFYFLQYVSTVYQESYLAWRLFISYNMCQQSTKNLTFLGGFLFPTICVNSLPRILPCLGAFYFLQYVSTVYQESYLAWRLFISYNMCQQSTKNLTLLGGFLFPTICVNSLPRILPCLGAFYFLQYVSTVYQESYLAWGLFISYNMCQQSTKNLTLLGGSLFPTICVNSLPMRTGSGLVIIKTVSARMSCAASVYKTPKLSKTMEGSTVVMELQYQDS